MAYAEQVTRETGRTLDRLVHGGAPKRSALKRSEDHAISETAANFGGTTDHATECLVRPAATTVVRG
jgi:hypothetical protein